MSGMKKTSKPIIGGILTIFSGTLGSLGIINYWVGIGDLGRGFGKGDIPPFVPSIIFGMPIPSLIIALLALAGGVFALKRKEWTWSVICAVAAALSFIVLGIPAILLVTLSKDEFS